MIPWLCISTHFIFFTFTGYLHQVSANHIVYITFSNHSILVQFVVDLEPVPGTLGVRQKYNPEGMPVLQKGSMQTHIHTLTPNDNFSQPIHLLASFWEVIGGNWRTQSKSSQTQGEHTQKLCTDSVKVSRLNQGPWNCEAPMEPTMPLCHLLLVIFRYLNPITTGNTNNKKTRVYNKSIYKPLQSPGTEDLFCDY